MKDTPSSQAQPETQQIQYNSALGAICGSEGQKSQDPINDKYTRERANVPAATINTSGNGSEDETEIQEASRLLHDNTGRMLFIGDSATLSYLHTLRQLIEGLMGSCALTTDPHRYKMVELSVAAPPSYMMTSVLPDMEAAMFLVDAFFANTKGFLHIFDQTAFTQLVERVYDNPLSAEPSLLCLLNLVFANGLQMRTNSRHISAQEERIIKRLTGNGTIQSEAFFVTAKNLRDPVAGFEDGGVTSIQALLLMTLYMLSVSKRNTAWVYSGMAIRLAYALGLHKAETHSAFTRNEQHSRLMLWRSLYVIDRFLSASLGRPTSVVDVDCSETFTTTPHDASNLDAAALLASVKSSRILGDILNRVYQKRRISQKLALSIAVDIHVWTKELPEKLSWRETVLPNEDPQIALTQLHLSLGYFHNVILLTRPFFQLHIRNVIEQTWGKARQGTGSISGPRTKNHNSHVEDTELKKFSGACVRSAMQSIQRTHTIWGRGAMPIRDPFIM